MKFSDLNKEQWEQWKPYLDTCLLPLTGLTGEEAPWEAAERLEELRDLLDYLETPFKGRLVTYPALHYSTSLGGAAVDEVCRRLKGDGFRYVVLAANPLALRTSYAEADLVVSIDPRLDKAGQQKAIHAHITALWENSREENA